MLEYDRNESEWQIQTTLNDKRIVIRHDSHPGFTVLEATSTQLNVDVFSDDLKPLRLCSTSATWEELVKP
jgi:hypothetical protein